MSQGLNLVCASLAQLERERAPWIGRMVVPRHHARLPETGAAGFRSGARHALRFLRWVEVGAFL